MSKLISEKKIMGTGPRLLKAADRAAPTLGAVAGLVLPFAAKGGGSMQGAISLIKSSASKFNFTSPLTTIGKALGQPNVYPIQSGVGTWLGGIVASEIGDAVSGDVGDFLKTGGSAMMKFGVSAAFGGVITSFFLEQEGPGMLGGIAGVGAGLIGAGGGDYTSRIRQDNPDQVQKVTAGGVTNKYQGTEF